MKQLSVVCLSLMFCLKICAHGFGKDAYVNLPDGRLQAIDNISKHQLKQKGGYSVLAYNENARTTTAKKIRSIGVSQSNCYCAISFNSHNSADICCTPDQEFYISSLKKWMPAFQLLVGDELQTKDGNCAEITHITFVQSPLEVFIIEVEELHTFFVSRYAVLTHNIILPIQVLAGFTIPFGGVAAGTIGSFFGPIGLTGGLVFGGLVGVMIKLLREDKTPYYKLSHYDVIAIDQYRKNMHQQDNDWGKPTEKDGYEPPKKWDGQKVRHPKTGNIGWPDKDGSVWVPNNPKGHGGVHWDVQFKNGKNYKNVYPGGKVRPGRK